MQVRPYKTIENQIEGVLLAFIDINEPKQFSNAIVETIGESLLVLDSQFRVVSANASFYKTFQTTRAETENRVLFDLAGGTWNIPGLRELLAKVQSSKKPISNLEMEYDFPKIGRKTLLLNACQLDRGKVGAEKILLTMNDITEQKRAEEQKRQIAGELQDTFGRRLSQLSAEAAEIAALIATQPQLAAERLQSSQKKFDALAKEMREFAAGLLPAQSPARQTPSQ